MRDWTDTSRDWTNTERLRKRLYKESDEYRQIKEEMRIAELNGYSRAYEKALESSQGKFPPWYMPRWYER